MRTAAVSSSLVSAGATLWGVGILVGFGLLIAIPHFAIGVLVGLVIVSLGTSLFVEGRARRDR